MEKHRVNDIDTEAFEQYHPDALAAKLSKDYGVPIVQRISRHNVDHTQLGVVFIMAERYVKQARQMLRELGLYGKIEDEPDLMGPDKTYVRLTMWFPDDSFSAA